MSATDTTMEPQAAVNLAPVLQKDRIFTLDMLRGWAILGILAVNAMAFAWPMVFEQGMGLIPPYPHDEANIVGHWATQTFFQDKFRSLFSMLFGCSIFLIGGDGSNLERNALLKRRLLWLLLIGFVHGLAFWFGDILMHYAYTGFIVMMMRHWSARRLILIGGGANLLFALLSVGMAMLAASGMMGAPGGAAPPAEGNPFMMTQAQVDEMILAYQNGWPGAAIGNAINWGILQAMSLFLIPITGGLMMLGMGLFKSGFMTGKSPTWVYLALFLLGAANLAGLGWYNWIEFHAAPDAGDPTNGMGNVMGSFAWVITLGYASMLILMTRFGLRWLTSIFIPVGRMAFTNYLTQTLIMTTIFYMPWGLHLYGRPEWGPGPLWMLVGGIWLTQLIWSPLWLAKFEMGPLEWLWRCLTYRRWVPIIKRAA